MSLIAIGSTFSGFLSSITRSAILPVSSEPLDACSHMLRSPDGLRLDRLHRRDSLTGPRTPPSRETRFTADHIMNIWSSGAT